MKTGGSTGDTDRVPNADQTCNSLLEFLELWADAQAPTRECCHNR